MSPEQEALVEALRVAWLGAKAAVDLVIREAEDAQVAGDTNRYNQILSEGRAAFVQLDRAEAAYVAAGGVV